MNIKFISLMAGLLMASSTTWGDVGTENGTTIQIILSESEPPVLVPPISNNLSIYMSTLGRPQSEPFVGFDGVDIGYGPGDGDNESVPFSFYFQPMKTVTKARLTLTLTFIGDLPKTDALIFAQQGNSTIGYGYTEIRQALDRCGMNKPCRVSFELGNISARNSDFSDLGKKDITNFVQGGQLDVIYSDDALVDLPVLEINGTAASPTPPLPILK